MRLSGRFISNTGTNTIFAHRDFRGGLLFDRLGVSAALAAADTPFTIVGVWLISPSNR